MNEVEQKILQAGEALVGKGLVEVLTTAKIGFWSAPSSRAPDAILLAEAVGEVFGRLWSDFEASGPLADEFLQSVKSVAASGGRNIRCANEWGGNYQFVVSIGSEVPPGAGPGIRLWASGWEAGVDVPDPFAGIPNPIMALHCASVGACESFKSIFSQALSGRAQSIPQGHRWSAWSQKTGPPPTDGPLNLGEVHLFGVGAVGHALVWILEQWPHEVSGTLHLIDGDKYDKSNAQRYLGMQGGDSGTQKVDSVARRLRARHRDLTVLPHPTEMNKYYHHERPDYKVSIAVAGLDSIELRRQLALKLPETVVNMWTSDGAVGASVLRADGKTACTYCIYPEEIVRAPDEVGQISKTTSIPPHVVKDLLTSGRVLSTGEAKLLVQRFGGDISLYQLRSLRSIVGELCATARIPDKATGRDLAVPTSFASALAGIGGFVSLLQAVMDPVVPRPHWNYSYLNYPLETNWQFVAPVTDCYLCGDKDVRSLLDSKYGLRPETRSPTETP